MTTNISLLDMNISAAFTGYRSYKMSFGDDLSHPDAIRLRASLVAVYERLIELGFRQFLTGGAVGCDLMAAEVILELKEKYKEKNLTHVLCIPCLNHTAKWSDFDRERLEKIMKKSVCYTVSETHYFGGCMQKRNRYMVDTCRVLIAVYDGQKGGTQGTVEYARKKNRKIVVIDPKQFVRLDLINSAEDAEFIF